MSARRFAGGRLVIASHNPGKVAEIASLLAPWGIAPGGVSPGGVGVVAAAALNLPVPEETGDSFEANAALKAHEAARATGLPALADDSGLEVAGLGGAPGIFSARWAGPSGDFAQAMETVEAKLAGERDRRARFVAVLALAWPDGHLECFRGEIEGTLVWPPRGARGFGYDPMFMPAGGRLTFGEMEPEAKHQISHRARAFAKLIAACFAP